MKKAIAILLLLTVLLTLPGCHGRKVVQAEQEAEAAPLQLPEEFDTQRDRKSVV